MSGIRYTTSVRRRAIDLREAEWSIRDVQRIMRSEGFDPVPGANAISCWSSERVADRQRASKRRHMLSQRMAVASFRWPGTRTPEWQVGRMRSLRAAGMTYGMIARAMNHDFGLDLTEDEVRNAVKMGSVPLVLRAAA